ncbi:Nucleotide-binding universal stress protein, UspA family [Micromonospora rhizosphaerae]|uniref:Nucleotide-binding universal stress protein, UspA family n=1 Tax=Micromonospora rhizosphaerae TaxID=568872 RepID=A0A1C6RZH7_9ACTN|nr:universal stress protein [Micromonospora rhizosphaerae]SCL22648.1 Nucleotide-binding universal stress protein, UspA family [Micromonospora rhizosphaerae]
MAETTHGAVVVGVGSSEEDLQVVRTAAAEAAAHDRPLHLLHAFNWAAAVGAPSVVEPRTDAEHLLERAGQAASEVEPAVQVSCEIVEGSPVEALVRSSESAFMVAVGDGGMADCPECVPADAPAVRLAARAGCPVLVGRAGPPPQGPVLVGVNGSESSRTALGFAFECADRRSAPLLAVRVIEPGQPDEGDDALAKAVTRYGERHPSVAAECHTIRGDPGTVLVEQSRLAQVALVGARGEEPWRGMLGAVSQTLLYHSPAPVVVVRGLAEAAPDGA